MSEEHSPVFNNAARVTNRALEALERNNYFPFFKNPRAATPFERIRNDMSRFVDGLWADYYWKRYND